MAGSTGEVIKSLAVNAIIAVSKGIGAALTGSGAMLAETLHSFADCGNQLLLLLGIKQSGKPADDKHPLGYGRSMYFWSFIVALLLFSGGGMFSIYEGVHKLHSTEPVENAWVAMAILAFGIAAESVSLWGCLREVNKDRGRQSLWRWFRSSRQSELLVVFAEDIAALGGLTIALAFIGLAVATGNPAWDAAGSIAIGALLVLVAVLVGVEVKSLLIGQSVEARVLARMRQHLEARPEVDTVYNLLTQQLGSDVMVAVKAKMRPAASAAALIAAVNAVERDFRSAFPQVHFLFFEPDLAD